MAKGEGYLTVEELMKKFHTLDNVSKIELRHQLSRKTEVRNGPIIFIWKTYLHPESILSSRKMPWQERFDWHHIGCWNQRISRHTDHWKKNQRIFSTIEDLKRCVTEEYYQNTLNLKCTFNNKGESFYFIAIT
jgi:hypothetical protein